MSSSQVDVTVVYSDKGSRPIRRVAGGAARVGSRRGLALVGLLSLLLASGMIYVTWWPANHFIYMTFTTKTPVPGIDTDQLAMLFGIRPSMAKSNDLQTKVDDAKPSDSPRFVGVTATKVIGISAYGWLTLSTLAACLLAMSAGVAWSCSLGRFLRKVGLVLFVLGLAGLVVAAYLDWKEYGRLFPTAHVRFAMASLMVLAMMLGLAIGRGVKGFFRVGSIAVILAGVGTAAALYLGGECAAISPELSAPIYMLKAFAVHSAYGWILLFIGPRVAPK